MSFAVARIGKVSVEEQTGGAGHKIAFKANWFYRINAVSVLEQPEQFGLRRSVVTGTSVRYGWMRKTLVASLGFSWWDGGRVTTLENYG